LWVNQRTVCVEIKLRASKRIGELVADLEKQLGKHLSKAHADARMRFKEEAIRKAGLSIRTAQEYQELVGAEAGTKDERAMKAATFAMEL